MNGEFIYVFLERGKGREKKRKWNIEVRVWERNIDPLPLGDGTHNAGMCPEKATFSSEHDAQPTEPRWLGLSGEFDLRTSEIHAEIFSFKWNQSVDSYLHEIRIGNTI